MKQQNILQPIDPKRKSKGFGVGAYDSVNDFCFSSDINRWMFGKTTVKSKAKF